jgi:hypothetical protein
MNNPITKIEFDDFVERLRYWNKGKGTQEHYTANPIFIVQKKVHDYGYDPDFDGTIVWLNDGQEVTRESLIEDLDEDEQRELMTLDYLDMENAEDIQNLEDEELVEALQNIGYENLIITGRNSRWEYICSHFTKEGAKAFIKRKKHDYPLGLRIYVDAQIYCAEWESIIEGLLNGSITYPDKK